MINSPVKIAEWEDKLAAVSLTARDRLMVEQLSQDGEPKVVVEELRDGVRIRARSWVGVLRFERFQVSIEPKLAGDQLDLIRMVEFTTGLEALSRQPGPRDLPAGGTDLFDLVALLLVEACERLIQQGLFADYVEREDDLPVVRGRLLADRQLLKNYGRPDRIACRFDEHEHDLPENQLLDIALRQCSMRVRHGGVRRRARAAQGIFDEICDPAGLDIRTAMGEFWYHRLNEHYRDAHALAQLILGGLGIKDLLASGETRCFAFLIDMNLLFERFVCRLLSRLLPHADYRVDYQHVDRSIIWDRNNNRPYARVIPDVLVESVHRPHLRVAIDAKYKLYDNRKIDPGDVYQTFLYAYAYGGSGGERVPASILLYPSTSHTEEPLCLQVRKARSASTERGAEITAFAIAIPIALDEGSRGVRGPATAPLIQIVESLIGAPAKVA